MLLAAGLVGSGFLAVPILTGSSAYAFAEIIGQNRGLDQKPRRAPHFYLLIAVSTIAGMLMNFIGVNPMSALFWTAVLNGFVAPPLLVLLMLVSNNRSIMGDRVNGPGINLLGWMHDRLDVRCRYWPLGDLEQLKCRGGARSGKADCIYQLQPLEPPRNRVRFYRLLTVVTRVHTQAEERSHSATYVHSKPKRKDIKWPKSP